MNIVFIADIVPYPPNTGIKIRTYNIIKQLSMQGNNVYVLCFNHKIFINDEKNLQDCIVELNNICSEVHIFQIPSENNLISKYTLYLKNIFSKEPYRVAR